MTRFGAHLTRKRFPVVLLALGSAACVALGALELLTPDAKGDTTVAGLLDHAERHAAAEEWDDARAACWEALALRPLDPSACLRMTHVLLAQGDRDALWDWMDQLTIDDPRMAERLFDLPDFRPHLTDPAFQALAEEARIQARD